MASPAIERPLGRQQRLSGVLFLTLLFTFVAMLSSVAIVGSSVPGVEAALTMGVAFLIGLQGVRTDCGWNAAMRCSGHGTSDSGTTIAHSFGIVLGALTTGLLAWAIGLVIQLPAAAVGGAFILLGAARVFRPHALAPGGWKVRRQWDRWGAMSYMFVFGFCIGLGFLTTMASPLFISILGFASISSLALSLGILLWFGAGRLLTTWLVAISDAPYGPEVTRTADRMQVAVGWAGRTEAVVGIVLGLVLVFR